MANVTSRNALNHGVHPPASASGVVVAFVGGGGGVVVGGVTHAAARTVGVARRAPASHRLRRHDEEAVHVARVDPRRRGSTTGPTAGR